MGLIFGLDPNPVSFYNYIDKIPTYIHNTQRNFVRTAEDIEAKTTEETIYKNYVTKILDLQKKREDDILIQLFGTKNCDIMEEFVKNGFIMSEENVLKITQAVKALDYTTISKDWLKKAKENNLSVEDTMKKIEEIWKEYREKVNNIESVLNSILDKINGGNISSDLVSLKKRLDGLKDYKWDKKRTPQENMIEELRRTQGVLSNAYKDITEGYQKKTEVQILEEFKSQKNSKNQFAILKEADAFRSGDKNLKTLAKSDHIIVKIEDNILIPIGGITIKKSASGVPKIHDTTSMEAFFKTMKEVDFIQEKEKKQDIDYLTYLFGNTVVYSSLGSAKSSMNNIIKKYGLIFFAGTIANEVLNMKIETGINFLKTNEIFNKEHADFLYITTDKQSGFIRVSEELEKIFKEGFSIQVSIKETKKAAEEKRKKLLEEASNIKKDFSPYTYDEISNNNLFINKMNNFYKSEIEADISSIRLDSKGVIL